MFFRKPVKTKPRKETKLFKKTTIKRDKKNYCAQVRIKNFYRMNTNLTVNLYFSFYSILARATPINGTNFSFLLTEKKCDRNLQLGVRSQRLFSLTVPKLI